MKVDTITKDYVQDADIFADIFNFFVYSGKQVIQPEQLSEKDSAKTTIPFGKDGKAVPIQRYRDVQMLYSAKTDGRVFYILYGTELQATIHYAMPVKNNLYDAVDYASQVDETAKRHRKEMEQNSMQTSQMRTAAEVARNRIPESFFPAFGGKTN